GIASMSVKVAITGDAARVVSASGRPSFYFFFDASNAQTANIASSWSAGSAQTVSSPNEFTLIKLMEKKGRREARVGSMNIGGAGDGPRPPRDPAYSRRNEQPCPLVLGARGRSERHEQFGGEAGRIGIGIFQHCPGACRGSGAGAAGALAGARGQPHRS